MDVTSPIVAALAALAKRLRAALVLDEAHAIGVLGRGRRRGCRGRRSCPTC